MARLRIALLCLIASPLVGPGMHVNAATNQPPVVVKLLTDDAVITPDGLAVDTVHLEIQPTNASAAISMAQQRIPFTESMQQVDIVEAYTLKPDGKKLPVGPAAIYIQQPQDTPQAPMFDDRRQKVIIFPDVSAGDVIVFTYATRATKPLFPKQYFEANEFSRLVS